MKVFGQNKCALQEKNQGKWAGRARFLNPWIWKRAFVRLKAEGGQNVLISCRAGWMIWNGPGPLCVVVIQGELLLQVVYSSLHVTKCPHHFSRHSAHKHAIVPEIEHHCHPHSEHDNSAICTHYLGIKTLHNTVLPSLKCFDLKCFSTDSFSAGRCCEWQMHGENGADASSSCARKQWLWADNKSCIRYFIKTNIGQSEALQDLNSVGRFCRYSPQTTIYFHE